MAIIGFIHSHACSPNLEVIKITLWCDGGRTQRSRVGTLTDKAVKTAKIRAAEATLGTVEIDNNVLGNVYSFDYLGSRLQGDGDDEADVRYRMDIAQAAFASLSHLWTDHRLSRNLKLRLYNLCVCSTLTHSCEAWNLTKTVSRILNGFNSRCLITGEEYRVTAVSPAYNLLLYVRQRRLRYLGHLLRLPHDSVVRRTLIAMADGGNRYPEGSLFMDCQGLLLKDLETLAVNRTAWRSKVATLVI